MLGFRVYGKRGAGHKGKGAHKDEESEGIAGKESREGQQFSILIMKTCLSSA